MEERHKRCWIIDLKRANDYLTNLFRQKTNLRGISRFLDSRKRAKHQKDPKKAHKVSIKQTQITANRLFLRL